MAWFLPDESYPSSRSQCCYLETREWHSGNVRTLTSFFPEKQEEGRMGEGKHPPHLTSLCSTEKPEKKKTWGCIKTPKIKLYGSVYFLKSSTREQDRRDSYYPQRRRPTGRLGRHQEHRKSAEQQSSREQLTTRKPTVNKLGHTIFWQ